MAVKLWTVHFMRICVANLLLFISLYILFPVLSVEMADRLGVPVAQTGVIFLFFTLGMFLIGPFHAYLVDAYKRKYMCMFSFALMVAATAGYTFVTNVTELVLLSRKCQLFLDGTSGDDYRCCSGCLALSELFI